MKRRKPITDLARDLRKNPTDSEHKLWQYLRKRRLGGYRFVRQKPFIYEQRKNQRFFFIADFYCAQKKTIIELDGKVHNNHKYYDYYRDLVLKELGLSTLRVKNEELSNIEQVKAKILNYLEN